jgi:hypothetical protein
MAITITDKNTDTTIALEAELPEDMLNRLMAVGELQPGKAKAVVLDAPAYPAVVPSGGNSETKALVSMPFTPPLTEADKEPLPVFT